MRQIIYCPPDKEKIEHVARQACKAIAKKRGDKFRSYEVITGLAEIIHIAAEMKAQRLNHQQKQKKAA